MFNRLVVASATVLMLTTTSFALIAGEDVETEKNAVWGSQLRDYLCTEDNIPIQTSQGINAFKLKVDDKDGLISSVKLIEVSKGPNGESVEYSGDKFIAVEITLGYPRTPKKDEFEVYYTVEARRNIDNGDDERQLDKGDEMSGSWIGLGRYSTKTVGTSMTVSESAEYTAYDSADNDIKTVIKFGSEAVVAADWKTYEDPKYMNFTTELEDSGLDSEFIREYKNNLKYIMFKGTPEWRNPVRLVLLYGKGKLVYTRTSEGWIPLKPCVYESTLKGYVTETEKLTEYLISDFELTPEGKIYVEPIQVPEVEAPEPEPEPIQVSEIKEPEPEPILEEVIQEPEPIQDEADRQIEEILKGTGDAVEEPEEEQIQQEPITLPKPTNNKMEITPYESPLEESLKESEVQQVQLSWWQRFIAFVLNLFKW